MAGHWYWLGAIPAMVFLGIVMMPFYYISKTHSVPGYLQLPYGSAASALSAVTFAIMTILMSGVNMYAMAVVMKVVLGWDINFSIWVSSLTVGIYVAAGGLFSAIFNEVLQFFLIWFGALLIPILGMVETGGWHGMVARIHQNFPGQDFTHGPPHVSEIMAGKVLVDARDHPVPSAGLDHDENGNEQRDKSDKRRL